MAVVKPVQNAASIVTGQPVPGPAPIDALGPDVAPGSNMTEPPTFATEGALPIPEDFDSLTTEEKEKWMALYRFHGIRLRADIVRTIPVSRETLDL
jgi:hypothetical protein